jgi:hypothetical protein
VAEQIEFIEYFEVDAQGNFVENYYWTPEEYEEAKKDTTRIFVDFRWQNGFYKPKFDFATNTWIEGEDFETVLRKVKDRKIDELNRESRNAILHGFTHVVNGVEYHFNYAETDQINFGDSQAILKDNIIPQIPWTVYTKDGQVARIIIDKALMDELTIAIMQHKNGKISHFRDVLLPLVENATTIAEVEAVKWNI